MNEKLTEILKSEGVVSITTCQNNEPHVVNTWNSYINVTDEETLLIPVYGMRKTEKNLIANNSLIMTLGSKEVMGYQTMGTGVVIVGSANFITEGEKFDVMKEKFAWANRVLEVTIESVKQTV